MATGLHGNLSAYLPGFDLLLLSYVLSNILNLNGRRIGVCSCSGAVGGLIDEIKEIMRFEIILVSVSTTVAVFNLKSISPENSKK